ncbi:MAG: hypothetical protein LBC91_01475, partial [Candidatus Accumulibacter sp.]|nr:hypothetical protein [Accumulibacter sp.]
RQQSDVFEQEKIMEEEDSSLSIDGVVMRSGGKRTVWINGAARDDEAAGAVIIPERADPGRVLVHPEGAPAIRAGVGDTVDRNTGETDDRLGGGWIRVKPVPRQ